MSLRAKFVFSSLLLVLVTLAAAALSFYVIERRHLEKGQAQRSSETLKSFSRVCQESLIEKNDITLLQYAKTLMESPAVRYAALLDPEGRFLFHTRMLEGDFDIAGGRWEGRPPGAENRAGFTRRVVSEGAAVEERALPVEVYGAVSGTALIGFDLGRMEAELSGALKDIFLRFLWVFLAALFAGILGAVAMASHLNSPILKLVEGTRRIAGGDLDSRITLDRKDELGVLAEEFNHMAGRLSEVDGMKDRFIASVTHDLRSPLTAVKGRAELLLGADSAGLNEKQLRSVKMIQQSSEELERFINDILDIARTDAGKLPVKKEEVDAGAVAGEVSEELSVLSRMYKISLETGIARGQYLVLADRGHLKRILNNLVSNAIKFTPERGKISIGAARAEGGTEIWVSDTGIGIAEDKLQGIFSKFFQVTDRPASVREIAGTGLGLAIARELVEANGGKIRVESRLNRGSKFVFVLPEK